MRCSGEDSPIATWVQLHVQQTGSSLEAAVAPFLHIPDHVAAAHKPGAALKQTKAWLQVRRVVCQTWP